MSKLKMSSEELREASLRSADLIRRASKAGLRAVEEMSKHPLSLEQMRQQVKKQQQAMAHD